MVILLTTPGEVERLKEDLRQNKLETKEVLEAAEILEKEVQVTNKFNQYLLSTRQSTNEERLRIEESTKEQIETLEMKFKEIEEENKRLFDTLVRHSREKGAQMSAA